MDTGVAGGGDDVLGGTPARGEVANREGHLGTRAGECPGGFDADARCSAGDDGPPAGEIDAGHNLGGGRLRGEHGGEGSAQAHDLPVLLAGAPSD